MNTVSNEAPKWAMSIIEGLTAINANLAERVKGLSDRLDALEGKAPEKPENPRPEATKEELNAVMERIII